MWVKEGRGRGQVKEQREISSEAKDIQQEDDHREVFLWDVNKGESH